MALPAGLQGIAGLPGMTAQGMAGMHSALSAGMPMGLTPGMPLMAGTQFAGAAARFGAPGMTVAGMPTTLTSASGMMNPYHGALTGVPGATTPPLMTAAGLAQAQAQQQQQQQQGLQGLQPMDYQQLQNFQNLQAQKALYGAAMAGLP